MRSPTFARAAGFAAWACVCRRSQLCGRCCSASLRGGGKDGSPVAAATGVGLHPEAATKEYCCANSPFHLGEHFFFFRHFRVARVLYRPLLASVGRSERHRGHTAVSIRERSRKDVFKPRVVLFTRGTTSTHKHRLSGSMHATQRLLQASYRC